MVSGSFQVMVTPSSRFIIMMYSNCANLNVAIAVSQSTLDNLPHTSINYYLLKCFVICLTIH